MNARADWLLKLQIFFSIHLRAIRAEFAPENVVIFAGINELNSSFCAIVSHSFSIYLNNYSPQCRYPPQASSVNSC